MPIDARTSGGVYKVVSKILTADGSEIGKVVDSTGRIIYEASRLITVTGVPPISFTKSIGKPLVSWDLLGNAQQTGTPAPDNVIMPEFCGVRTAQLLDIKDGTQTINNVAWAAYHGTITAQGVTTAGSASDAVIVYDGEFTRSGNYINYCRIQASKSIKPPSGTYTFSANANPSDSSKIALIVGDNDGRFSDGTARKIAVGETFSVNGNEYIMLVLSSHANLNQYNFGNIMLNSGSTALPYEPYGWKIPITCAGQTVPVYLGQTQTVRRVKKLVLTGKETWTLQSINDYGIANLWTRLPANFDTQYLGLSSHFTIQRTVIAVTEEEGFFLASGIVLYIRINATRVSTTAELKSYLAAQYAAGTPVTVWYVLETPETAIVNEPLAKISNYADELHSTDAAVTIPTANGNNTLTVDTDLQPSSMTIVYKGR